MRPIPENHSETLTITVTDDMTVNFTELGPLHPVYSTYTLAKHFEEAGRKLLLPFLEPGEDSIGIQVETFHTGSALPGMEVTVTATLQEVSGRRIVCALRAVSSLGDEIGHGTASQLVLPEEKIRAGFEALRERFAASRQPS
ncbi:thioesterase family protein [Deinococcus sp. SL84]|uniref:thioesterase family protein n=1 Tax=Deinococcus sp. SL84 TaxID=2994663 RepID=UPI0022733886|nr:thioesterase family protein [Deinococcus sp. SL84]MCY1701791.1 thioesterase family protein [Deinococcus sp. SL84]